MEDLLNVIPEVISDPNLGLLLENTEIIINRLDLLLSLAIAFFIGLATLFIVFVLYKFMRLFI